MLDLPEIGFSKSISRHNVEPDILCDWIEASVLFLDDRVSQPKIVDTLCDFGIYEDRDFASELVSSSWSELRRRHLVLGKGSPYRFEGLALTCRRDPWDQNAGHAFCVLLSLSRWYKAWAKQFGRDYTEQGVLFEELTMASLKVHFAGWSVLSTGWSKTAPSRLAAIVKKVADELGEPIGDIRWSRAEAKDAGLDLVCMRSFSDERGGRPAFLVQCASGDWTKKLGDPNLSLWCRLIDFRARNLPTKAFATPFAFSCEDFARNCNLVEGLLMDRYRLLAAFRYGPHSLPKSLANRLRKWARPRLRKLPVLEE